MPDSIPGGKKRKITIVACPKGVEIAETALKRLGFESKSNFAKSQLLARSTVTKFFTQQSIQLDSFKKICKALELNWKKIAELQVESKNFERIEERQVESILSIREGVELVQTIARRVVPVDEQGQEIKIAAVILEGDINSVQTDLLFWCEVFSKKYPGSNIKVTSIKPGSIKLIIEGTQKDIEMLLSDFESGNLTEIAGFPVEDAQLLSESAEDDERSKQKWRLVEEIVNNPIKGRNLSGTDLSDADLRNTCLIRANLSDADLSNSDLSDANLSGSYLWDTNLSGVNLSDAYLSGAYLWDANLSGTNLSGAYLWDAKLRHANLSNANLIRAKLRHANLIRANLSNANLSNANLIRANLLRADLRGAYLRGADLIDAYLRGADLSGANLIDANLSGANLIDANLSGANLIDAQVENARFRGSLGISESMKQDLIKRGAIFEDSSGDRSQVPVNP